MKPVQQRERDQGEDSKTAEVDETLGNANIIAKGRDKSNIVFALSLLSPGEYLAGHDAQSPPVQRLHQNENREWAQAGELGRLITIQERAEKCQSFHLGY